MRLKTIRPGNRNSTSIRGIAVSVALVGVASATTARGDVIAFYGFGTPEAPTYASTDVEPHSAAGLFAPAAGLGSTGNWNSTNNGINTAAGSPAPEFAVKPISQTQESAFTADAYWSFTVTPDNNYELNLTSLTFDLVVANSARPISYYLSTSVAGFDEPVQTPVIARTTGGFVTLDLSGPSLQNLADPVEIRLYLFGELVGSSGSRWAFDNVTLNGSVSSVPEPTSLLLVCAGVSLALSRRRLT